MFIERNEYGKYLDIVEEYIIVVRSLSKVDE